MCVLQFSGWLSVKILFIACAKFPVSFACTMDSQDLNPIKYSIGEAISKQVQTVFRFGCCSYSYNVWKTEDVCVHASADYKFHTNNLKTNCLCLFVQPFTVSISCHMYQDNWEIWLISPRDISHITLIGWSYTNYGQASQIKDSYNH